MFCCLYPQIKHTVQLTSLCYSQASLSLVTYVLNNKSTEIGMMLWAFPDQSHFVIDDGL